MFIKKSKKLPRITRKSLLYRSKVDYGDFCINHVEGCSNGCKYPCYAMMMALRYGKIKSYKDWIRPKIVGNALELLEKEIPKYKNKINFVHLCFSTDPFMYRQKEVADLTLKIIERLNRDSIRCTVLTKGVYPKKLANTKKYSRDNIYGITLVSLDKNFKRKIEPFSAPFENRIKSLKYLHDKKFKTWVSMEPYPTPSLVQQDLSKILKKISFVDKIIFGRLNYRVEPSQSVCEEDKKFYDQCANEVISFCKKRGIDYHIKKGTQKKDNNKKTEKIFRAVRVDRIKIEPLLLPA
ncbi:radical SAM protein [Candidatus Parcubacteria bacterium]|nr:radical SAM protein [Candidatus Parcubacteria bacterium]